MRLTLISGIILYLIFCYSLYLMKPDEIMNNKLINYPVLCILISIMIALFIE